MDFGICQKALGGTKSPRGGIVIPLSHRLAPKPLRVRNQPSAGNLRGNADKHILTFVRVLVSRRSTCKVANFFFATFFLFGKEKR